MAADPDLPQSPAEHLQEPQFAPADPGSGAEDAQALIARSRAAGLAALDRAGLKALHQQLRHLKKTTQDKPLAQALGLAIRRVQAEKDRRKEEGGAELRAQRKAARQAEKAERKRQKDAEKAARQAARKAARPGAAKAEAAAKPGARPRRKPAAGKS
ncbi:MULTISPECIES: hypothetical protein [unclassified Paracoccus (in: a-proteobacteria)]|uniref:hypothetical protein n=1 Tax=unclassified Paracoccus (in: a-proteobacteria) TaxID=2688777 RepID=UPI0012B3B315|nr:MULTISPECIES: hypothetical protein [unclassified Paracoccus (in: a-proteobacteria)]UXU76116.1 hypothetical protein GB879_006465 [Paracoccus sp. SMMA_5]UXU82028.1 hypothetical protein GB880_006450 [Paracoccus sp. SMMA_5_TC]